MKKLFISLALVLLCVAQVNAQSKEAESALKGLAKAKETSQNPKKADRADTWMKLGNAYAACYDAPINGLWIDAPQMQVKLLLKDQTVTGSQKKEVNGQVYTVDSYADKDLYYDASGKLAAWVIKQPTLTDEDALSCAYNAFKKGEELKASKSDLTAAFKTLGQRYWQSAISASRVGDNKTASVCFEKSFEATSDPSVGMVDTMALYNAGVTASMSKDDDRAISLLHKCMEMNYDSNGEAYAYLSSAYKQKRDTAKAKEVLALGFAKYPTSQSILIELINTYLSTKDDPNKILEYIHTAQKNEPTNASLIYTEGNIYKTLKKYDQAIACYQKALQVDPTYVYAPFAEGDAYYSMGLELQEKAAMETDDAKYNALNEQLNQCLEKAIVPFEKAFSIAKDKEVQKYCAEYLKNIYFRFRDKNETYKAGYDKYNKFLDEASK
ncbi:MAG: tetratricopeptide repeat protein [Bacteroidales bacterium]|jgi:tetratricopeptide (TPR) repeat protein|nr:tetratricopeptide repeat protein [Bacteroidales bacterium]